MSGSATTRVDSMLAWFKSSYSSSGNGNSCVEVAYAPGTVHVRDSKYQDGSPRLVLGPEVWVGFVGVFCGRRTG